MGIATYQVASHAQNASATAAEAAIPNFTAVREDGGDVVGASLNSDLGWTGVYPATSRATPPPATFPAKLRDQNWK